MMFAPCLFSTQLFSYLAVCSSWRWFLRLLTSVVLTNQEINLGRNWVYTKVSFMCTLSLLTSVDLKPAELWREFKESNRLWFKCTGQLCTKPQTWCTWLQIWAPQKSPNVFWHPFPFSLSQTVTSCWVMPRATAATPLSTARTASVNLQASRGQRWCRRTAAAASCTVLTPASTWPSRWRRLWRAETSTRARSTSTRRMVRALQRG